MGSTRNARLVTQTRHRPRRTLAPRSWIGERRAALAAAALVSLGCLCPALGQGVPSNVVQSVASLAPGDQAAIKSFVDRHAPDLAAQEPSRIRDARVALMTPLSDPRVGVPFRLEMSRQLAPSLERLAQDSTPVIAVNAVRLAGELATDRSADVVASALTSRDSSVRLAAAAAAGRVFEAVRTTTPALNLDAARRLAQRVADQFKAEGEPNVADALARALISAGSMSGVTGGFAAVRSEALERLSTLLSEPLQRWTAAGEAPDERARVETLLRTLSALRQEMAGDQNASSGDRLSEGAVRSAARLADQTLAFISAVAQGEKLPIVGPDKPEAAVRSERGWAVSATGAAEQVAFFARQRLTGRAPAAGPSLAAALEGGTRQGDARFVSDAEGLRRELGAIIGGPR